MIDVIKNEPCPRKGMFADFPLYNLGEKNQSSCSMPLTVDPGNGLIRVQITLPLNDRYGSTSYAPKSGASTLAWSSLSSVEDTLSSNVSPWSMMYSVVRSLVTRWASKLSGSTKTPVRFQEVLTPVYFKVKV